MTVAAYLRVSNLDQVEGFSLETQERIVREHCARQGWGEPRLYREEGRSAFTERIERRPQFRQLLEDAEAGHFRRLVVYQFDRFARWASVALAAHDRLKRAGVQLVSVTEPFDPATAFGKLQFTQMAGYAEYYSAQLSERLIRVNEVRRAKGEKLGPVNFGARKGEGGRQEVDPDKADQLRRLLELVAEYSYVEAARRLNAEGIRSQRGKVWQSSSLWRAVTLGSWLLAQPEPWPTLWLAARARRPSAPVRRDRRVKLLSGLARCACGGILVVHAGTKSSGRWQKYGEYFACRNVKGRPTGGACPHGRKRPCAWYEAVVTDAFLALPDLTQVRAPDPGDAAGEYRAVEEERRRLGVRYQHGLIDDAEFYATLAATDARLRELAGRALGEREPVFVALREWQELWPEMTTEERNEALRAVVARVVIAGRECAIEWHPWFAAALELARGG